MSQKLQISSGLRFTAVKAATLAINVLQMKINVQNQCLFVQNLNAFPEINTQVVEILTKNHYFAGYYNAATIPNITSEHLDPSLLTDCLHTEKFKKFIKKQLLKTILCSMFYLQIICI